MSRPVLKMFGLPSGGRAYELTLGERTWGRTVSERDLQNDETVWMSAQRVWDAAQELRRRADEVIGVKGSVFATHRRFVEPELEEEAWEKERSVLVAIFPDAEPLLEPVSREARDAGVPRGQNLKLSVEAQQGWDSAARVAMRQLAGTPFAFPYRQSRPPVVTREMVEGTGHTVTVSNPEGWDSGFMPCALCGAAMMCEGIDGRDHVEVHRAWHDELVRTREIPVRH